MQFAQSLMAPMLQKKQSIVWTLDREYRINRNVLEQHSGTKITDVAEILGGKVKGTQISEV